MSVRGEPIEHELEVEGLLLRILKELKMIRLILAEGNNSELREDEIDV